jgi:hypothetical protein
VWHPVGLSDDLYHRIYTPERVYSWLYGCRFAGWLYAFHLRADSIQNELDDRDLYILNLRRIMEGEEILTQMPDIPDTMPSMMTLP